MSDIKDPTKEVSKELIGMSKEEALKYLELPFDANDYEIDDKFWQLSKRLRTIKDEPERKQKMVDLSYVYDVATGKEEARLKALQEHDAAPKFLGKTKAEWKNYVFYSWYKYLIGVVIIVVAVILVKQIFFTPDEDVAVLSVGHFNVDVEVMEAKLLEAGFEHPYVTCVDLAVSNDQNQTTTSYAESSATVLFLSEPELVVMDEATVFYFYGNLGDMSAYYEDLKLELSDEVLNKITPIYFSEYEAVKLSIDYQEKLGSTEIDYSDLETADRSKVLIGLEIKDKELINKLGYTNLWPESEDTLVFCFGNKGDNMDPSKSFLTSILKEVS